MAAVLGPIPDPPLTWMLALVETESGTIVADEIRISCYTRPQLESASGTLFGMHLQRDGVILFDPRRVLTEVVARFASVDTEVVLNRLAEFAVILDPGSIDVESNLSGVVRIGRYLLRTALYTSAIIEERPCFSVRELAERHADPSLVHLLSSHESEQIPPDRATLDQIRKRLSHSLSMQLRSNPFGSIAALATMEWDANRPRATLAILALSDVDNGGDFDYSELPKVLL